MQILDLIQGSEEWKAERLKAFTASEAPIMMGASPYMSRDDLLTYKTTGDEQEITRFQQIIFDKGHASEATARPLAEARCFDGDELFPLTGLLMVDGMRMLASFDGIVMPMQNASWEHKQFNKELYELVKSGGELEPKHYWQLEQQALVGDLEKIVFTVSDGTDENKADLVYIPRPERRAELIAHWKQFAIDLDGYVPQVFAAKPIAQPVPTLPAIRYEIDLTKGIAIHSNMDAFKLAAQELVKMSECELVTDQDFENAKARIKECEKAEKNIDSLIERVLGDLGDANKFKLDMESIKEWIRKSRLNQSNKVASRDKDRRREIIQDGETTLSSFISTVNEKLYPIILPTIKADFAAAIKGKSKFENMISAVNDEVARVKVEAVQLSEKITTNIQLLRMIAGEYMELFADLQTICVKDTDYIKAIAKQRVDEHKAAEQKRIQEEAQRIAAEQIEKDRKAEIARQQEQQTAKQKPIQEAAPEQSRPSIPDDYEQYAAQITSEYEQQNNVPAFVPAERPMYVAPQAETESQKVEPSEYQNGFIAGRIAGLDLALMIFAKEGALGFAKAVEDFIEVGAPEEVSKAA